MSLTLRVTNSPDKSLAVDTTKVFGEDGGTIGRSLSNDWVLPDPSRYVSGRHASIDYQSGAFYLTDTSTNGVYVNDSRQPIASGSRRRLNDGDRLKIGDYEVVVSVGANGQADTPNGSDSVPVLLELTSKTEIPEDPTGPHGAFGQSITHTPKPRRRKSKRASETVTAMDAVARKRSDSSANKPAPAPASKAKTKARHKAASNPAARKQSAERPARTDRRPTQASDSQAIQAFMRGAGLADDALSHKSAIQMMHAVGQLVREMVLGLMETHASRGELKNRFRISQTTIQPGENNPLKFSAGVEEALRRLFVSQGSRYLTPVDAVRDSFGDVRIHQTAMVEAMQQALEELVQRFEPDELRGKFDRGLKRGGLLGATSKLKYWELYGEFYQAMVHNRHAGFPNLFSDEFSRSYEAEVDKLRAERKS